MDDILIIGGGPAGMLAACTAAERGKSVRLFEKNQELGKKLLITGKGRCNLTNAATPDVLIENMPGNPLFMYSSFYSFGSSETIAFFNGIGLPTKVERGNRVFPVSDCSADVVSCLYRHMKKLGVKLHLNADVSEINISGGCVAGITTASKRFWPGKSVVIATGGLSYPSTGSTGDGYKFARETGHHVTRLYPSLAPLIASDKWVAALEGLSLKNIAIKCVVQKKAIYSDFGELVFTAYGVSGPVILSASRFLIDKYDKMPSIIIDLKPALSEKELDRRVLRDFSLYANKDLKNALNDLLPKRLIPIIIASSGLPENTKPHELSREQRLALVGLLKGLRLTITGSAGFKEAVVTSGGVSVDDIDPSTMRSKIIEGLFFAGEIIDIDGYTGGFNLQAAFSTGYLAGKNI